MDNYKTKIRFSSVDEIISFVDSLVVFEADVNVKYNSNTYDGKSLLALMCIPLNSILDVELVTVDECMKVAFHKYINNLTVRDGVSYV